LCIVHKRVVAKTVETETFYHTSIVQASITRELLMAMGMIGGMQIILQVLPRVSLMVSKHLCLRTVFAL